MRNLAILVGTWVMTVSGSTLANPVMIVEETYADQFSATTHVQVTQITSMTSPTTMAVTRDGKSVDVHPEPMSAGSRDLGSGMTSLHALVGCDCNVPVGKRTYSIEGNAVEVTVVAASEATGAVRNPSAACDVKCAATDPFVSSAGGSGGEKVAPLPVAGGNPGMGGGSATGSGGITAVGPSSSASPANQEETSDSSGCTVSRTTVGLLPAGILVALGLLLSRRRK